MFLPLSLPNDFQYDEAANSFVLLFRPYLDVADMHRIFVVIYFETPNLVTIQHDNLVGFGSKMLLKVISLPFFIPTPSRFDITMHRFAMQGIQEVVIFSCSDTKFDCIFHTPQFRFQQRRAQVAERSASPAAIDFSDSTSQSYTVDVQADCYAAYYFYNIELTLELHSTAASWPNDSEAVVNRHGKAEMLTD
jgi:hypothetical protein